MGELIAEYEGPSLPASLNLGGIEVVGQDIWPFDMFILVLFPFSKEN